MASNPTPDSLDELIAAGEDMCDGPDQHGVALGVSQNTFVKTRADLDALPTVVNEQSAAEGAQPAAYDAQPVKLINVKAKQQTFEGLPVGATVEFTVSGVNDAGEGPISEPVTVVAT